MDGVGLLMSPLTLGLVITGHLARMAEALNGPQPLGVHQRLVRRLGCLSGLAANVCMDRHDTVMADGYARITYDIKADVLT